MSASCGLIIAGAQLPLDDISFDDYSSEENDASLEAFNMYLDQGYFWKPREDEKLRAFVKKHGPKYVLPRRRLLSRVRN